MNDRFMPDIPLLLFKGKRTWDAFNTADVPKDCPGMFEHLALTGCLGALDMTDGCTGCLDAFETADAKTLTG